MRPMDIRALLLSWFAKNAREMAWRSNPTPWHVWVSEIMLQQTRVESVHGYFARFMARFPSPTHVAEAPIEDLLDAWAGLGYYSRVRNLQHACQQVALDYDGEVPNDPIRFGALKGVGKYTCGAVMSIAFGRPEPIVDGNVERVFSRLFLIEENIRSNKAKKKFWSLASDFVEDLPDHQSAGDLNQALMELGALVCKPKQPNCQVCPLSQECRAKSEGKTQLLPIKSKAPPKRTMRWRARVVPDSQNRIWVVRRPSTGVLAGLWSLPMTEIKSDSDFQLSVTPTAEVKHAFTHLLWKLDVVHESEPQPLPEPEWGDTATAMTVSELEQVALGGPSLKALIAVGIPIKKRRGSGV